MERVVICLSSNTISIPHIKLGLVHSSVLNKVRTERSQSTIGSVFPLLFPTEIPLLQMCSTAAHMHLTVSVGFKVVASTSALQGHNLHICMHI